MTGKMAGMRDSVTTCSQGHRAPATQRYCGECGERLDELAPPVWSSATEALRVIAHRPHLHRALITTVIVGTVLFCINQLDVVLSGRATAAVWLKGGLTYLVPFIVSNVGILIATHRPASRR